MTVFLWMASLQGLAILVDEFVFHYRRSLPQWERIGHPVDTFTVVACLLYLAFIPRTDATEFLYYVMVVGSCLMVTKDEWVHFKVCTGEEMWLHAVLFVMHPLVLITAMNLWGGDITALLAVAGGVFVFFVYQVVYWNFIEPMRAKAKLERHFHHSDEAELYDYFGE